MCVYIGVICRKEVCYCHLFDSETHEIVFDFDKIKMHILWDTLETMRSSFGRGDVKFYIYPRVVPPVVDQVPLAVDQDPVVVGHDPVVVNQDPVSVGHVPVAVDQLAVGKDLSDVDQDPVDANQTPVAVIQDQVAVKRIRVPIDVEMVLIITGYFKLTEDGKLMLIKVVPDNNMLISVVPDNNPAILCLFKCFRDEVENAEIAEHLQVEIFNYIKRMPKYLCMELARFSGIPWARGQPSQRLPLLAYLSDLMNNSYNKCLISSNDSCVSSITPQSGARRSIIGQERLGSQQVPLFNPRGMTDEPNRHVDSFIVGRRAATVYDAFSDGLLKVGIKGKRFSLRSMLFEAKCELSKVGSYHVHGIKIFSDVYLLGGRSNTSCMSASNTYYLKIKDYCHVEHQKEFAKLFLTENFHFGDTLSDYQLAGLCINYKVNWERYDYSDHFGSQPKSLIAHGTTRFLYDPSFPTIKIIKCGLYFKTVFKEIDNMRSLEPLEFYSVIESSIVKSSSDRIFKDEHIFYTLLDKALWVVDYNESLVRSWKACIFEIFSDALKSHGFIDTSHDTRWLLSESQRHILNILERVDGNRKVFEIIYRERCEDLSLSDYTSDSLCQKLDRPCGGREGMKSNIEYRKLFSYLYLILELRSDDDTSMFFQLAALCLRFEVNIRIYSPKQPQSKIKLGSSGCKFYYGEDFYDIVIVAKNGVYGFQDVPVTASEET